MTKTWNLRSRLIAQIRRLFLYSPMRRDVLVRARVRGGYKCALCKRLHKKVSVDHVKPVIKPKEGFPQVYVWGTSLDENKPYDDWSRYIAFMFSGQHNLQALCKSCHLKKTREENKQRGKAYTSKRKSV